MTAMDSRPTKLLINEPPLQALPSLAVKIGLNEALMLQQIHYWIINPLNTNLHESKVWITRTYTQWQKEFPFWCTKTIGFTILRLERMGLLTSTDALNESWSNRSKSYTINYEELSKLDFQSGRTNIRPTSTSVSSGCHREDPSHCQQEDPSRCTIEESVRDNNNRYLGNTIEKDPSEPQVAIVVDEIRKMNPELKISDNQLIKWLLRYGEAYVFDKLRLMLSSKTDHPEKFLNSAIKLDWMPPTSKQPLETKNMTKTFPPHSENVAWFDGLSDDEKKTALADAVYRWSMLDDHLKYQNVNVLDEGFSSHPLFKTLMSVLGRAE